jgi:hypothetical protein
MVFITGTPEMKGRVASHPKKDASSSSSKKSSPMPESRPWKEPEIVPLQPLTSAWNDYVSLSRHGVECHALLTALQVPLHNVVRKENHPSQGGDFQISMAPYTPTELPLNEDEDGQNATAQCLVHVSSPTDGGGSGESYCAFLFEVRSTASVISNHAYARTV